MRYPLDHSVHYYVVRVDRVLKSEISPHNEVLENRCSPLLEYRLQSSSEESALCPSFDLLCRPKPEHERFVEDKDYIIVVAVVLHDGK